MIRVALDRFGSGLISRATEYLSHKPGSDKFFCSKVGVIQIVTQNIESCESLPDDIVFEALNEVSGKEKILVMRLQNHLLRGAREETAVVRVKRFRELGTDPLKRFSLIIDIPNNAEDYLWRFIQAENQVWEAEPGAVLREGKINFDDLIAPNLIPESASLELGEDGTHHVLSFGVFPPGGFYNGGTRMVTPVRIRRAA